MPKVAFVVQRCGREVNGGAESVCLQVAQRLSAYCETEILTTCALDYMRWENWYSPGTEILGATTIRRFPVDRTRDVASFNKLSRDLQARKLKVTLQEQEEWMKAQGPLSSALLEHLRIHENDYDAFIFFGYLYATTYFGLSLVADKSYLVPFAHDEWPIYFSMWEPFFSRPKSLIFSTDAERRFLHKRFPSLRLKGPTIGVGISPPQDVDPARFRRKYELGVPFLLYAGRIDESKGCHDLFEYFLRGKREEHHAGKLVLIGKEIMPVPFHDDIVYMGFVPASERWDAMAACDWLALPSQYESLSLALLETWSVGRPAIVNGVCEVIVDHCRAAHAGLWYNNFEEWNAIFKIATDNIKSTLGEQGAKYVEHCYSWHTVEHKYKELLQLC